MRIRNMHHLSHLQVLDLLRQKEMEVVEKESFWGNTYLQVNGKDLTLTLKKSSNNDFLAAIKTPTWLMVTVMVITVLIGSFFLASTSNKQIVVTGGLIGYLIASLATVYGYRYNKAIPFEILCDELSNILA